jgi:uncharacterized RDD family membrane protein YckC
MPLHENDRKEGGSMDKDWEYVGFWARTAASVIDLLLQLIITAPLTIAVYGQYVSLTGKTFQGPADVVINILLPAVAVIAFWVYQGATPGKMAMSAKVVDADTGEPVGAGQAALRYVGYIISGLPLGVGFFWAGLDRKKQGWHDKIAGTVVVRPVGTERVQFSRREPTFKVTEPRF